MYRPPGEKMAPSTAAESRTVNAADVISIRAVEAAAGRAGIVGVSTGNIDLGLHLHPFQGADGPEGSAP